MLVISEKPALDFRMGSEKLKDVGVERCAVDCKRQSYYCRESADITCGLL